MVPCVPPSPTASSSHELRLLMGSPPDMELSRKCIYGGQKTTPSLDDRYKYNRGRGEDDEAIAHTVILPSPICILSDLKLLRLGCRNSACGLSMCLHC
jgi:hypothetical protein